MIGGRVDVADIWRSQGKETFKKINTATRLTVDRDPCDKNVYGINVKVRCPEETHQIYQQLCKPCINLRKKKMILKNSPNN